MIGFVICMWKLTRDYLIYFLYYFIYKPEGLLCDFYLLSPPIIMFSYSFLFCFLTYIYILFHFKSTDRLVDCTALKRALEIVYAATLPKASKPFIYMAIILPPEHVDVNVHPTKREVCISFRFVIFKSWFLICIYIYFIPSKIGSIVGKGITSKTSYLCKAFEM